MTNVKSAFRDVVHFLTIGIWRIPLSTLPRGKSFLFRQLRVVLLAVRGFQTDKCSLRASALTLYTLLSLVPILAMAFGVAKGFGFEKKLETELMARLHGHEEVATRVVEFARNLLDNTKGGLVAGIGVAILFFMVVKVFANIERSFNDIWGVPKGRTWFRKFTDYLSMMLLLPVLLMVASTATAIITSQAEAIVGRISLLGPTSGYILAGIRLLPYTLIWVVFLVLYLFMPNTKVRFGSGFLAAVVAGTIYQAVQWVYFTFQIGVTKYSSIYGGFAALPLFIVWVQVSWVVVLLGAEVAFAHQNVGTYEFEPDSLRASHSFRKLVALAIMHHVVHNFVEGKKPDTANDLAELLQAPSRLVNEMCYELTEAGMLVETREDDSRRTGFLPARDSHSISIGAVTQALENRGSHDLPIAQTDALARLSDSLKNFDETVQNSPANVLLTDI